MNDNFDKKQQKKAEKQEVGKNTAHVAAKGAATYFGGSVGGRAYDALSRTKAGQRLENTAGKVIAKTPGLGQINKRLNDTGAVDAADKAVDALNGQKPKKGLSPKKSSDNNQTNKESNVPNALKNHNRSSYMHRHNQSQTNQNSDDETEDNNQLDDNYGEDTGVKENNIYNVFHISMRQKIIIVSSIVIFLFIGIVIVALISSIFGGSLVPMTAPIYGLNSNKEANSTYYYDETQPEKLKEEIDFNNAIIGSKDGTIPGIIDEYYTKYGVILDKYTLEGTLLYVYAIPRDTKTSEEEIQNNVSETESEIPFDFAKASKYIDTVASMMIEGSDNYYYSNVEKNGPFYYKLIDSDFLTDYYRDVLDYYNNKQELVDEIFNYIELLRYAIEGQNKSSSVIGDNTAVYLQTCDVPYQFKYINNMKIFDNPLVNEGTSYPLYLVFSDYIKGVVEGEIGGYIKEEYKEALKAMMVVSSTYIIGDSRSGFDLRTGEMYFPTGNCRQVSCDPNNGCSYVYLGKKYGTAYSGYQRFSSGNHPPLNASEVSLLNSLLGEVFGEIMVKKGVTSNTFSGSKDTSAVSYYSDLALCGSSRCMGQHEALSDALNGMNYKDILAKYYDSSTFDIINIKEGLYVEGANYENASYNGNVVFYDQNDYKSVQFCGRSGSTISSSGCGVTASAIVASTLLANGKYDPIYMMNLAYSFHECGPAISGTNAGFFRKFASQLNLGYQEVSKSQASQVVEALKTGKSMVIAHMGQGHFTNGGHYIVLSAVNQQGQVYVHDPNNRQNKINRGTGNGWYDLNMIASELRGSFHIITKR